MARFEIGGEHRFPALRRFGAKGAFVACFRMVQRDTSRKEAKPFWAPKTSSTIPVFLAGAAVSVLRKDYFRPKPFNMTASPSATQPWALASFRPCQRPTCPRPCKQASRPSRGTPPFGVLSKACWLNLKRSLGHLSE